MSAALTAHAPGAAPTARLILEAGDLNDPEYREVWEVIRRSGIGGSDVAAILGLGGGKYTSPRHVYEAKHGRPEMVDSEEAEIGREIEAFIARMFTKRSSLDVAVPPGTLAHTEHPWMLANVDRYVLDDHGQVTGPLECKSRSAYQLAEWEGGKVPDAPAIQCHWYMAVGGWSHGYVVALVGGNKVRWQRLDRDEELIGYLVDYCGKWYQRHVVEGAPPPADGYEATTNLLAKLWSVRPETVAQIDVAKARELRARRADVVARGEAIEAELRTVENEMRLLTGDHAYVKVGDKVAWSWKANGAFASKRFRKAEPELAAEYTHMVPAIDVDRLKAERPAVYDRYRARVLRVPAKEI